MAFVGLFLASLLCLVCLRSASFAGPPVRTRLGYFGVPPAGHVFLRRSAGALPL